MHRKARNGFSAALCALAICAFAQQALPVARTVPARPLLTPETSHGTLGRFAPDLPLQGDALAIPVAGVRKTSLVDTWGASRAGHLHSAIDILAPRGTSVVSAAPGTVLKLFTSRAGGLTVYVADPTKSWVYYYAHLDAYAPGLQEGQTVAQGDVLGFVGTTGNAPANTPHLHFEIERLPPGATWSRGEPVNPYPVLMARGQTFESR